MIKFKIILAFKERKHALLLAFRIGSSPNWQYDMYSGHYVIEAKMFSVTMNIRLGAQTGQLQQRHLRFAIKHQRKKTRL